MAPGGGPRPATVPAADERTLGQLMAKVSRDLSLLIHGEMELAKAELRTDVKRGGIGAGMFAVAGFLLLLAVVLFSVALAYGISALGVPLGAAYVIVAVLYVIVAGLLALIGTRVLKRIRPPERTIQTVKDDIAWLKHPTTVPSPADRSRAS